MGSTATGVRTAAGPFAAWAAASRSKVVSTFIVESGSGGETASSGALAVVPRCARPAARPGLTIMTAAIAAAATRSIAAALVPAPDPRSICGGSSIVMAWIEVRVAPDTGRFPASASTNAVAEVKRPEADLDMARLIERSTNGGSDGVIVDAEGTSAVEVQLHEVLDLDRLEGTVPGQELESHDAERVLVRARVDLLTTPLLG